MPVDERLFPEQEKNEKVFLLLRRHWFVYLLFWVMAVILLAPLVIFIIYWSLNPDLVSYFIGNILVIAIGCYLLGILALMLYGFVSFYLDIDIVTDRRIVNIDQKGFFKREISELNLHQIQDARAHVRGIFETMFHFGDVYIQTAGGRPNFTFNSIPNPYKVAKKIIDLNEAAIESEEVEVLQKAKSDKMEDTLKILTDDFLIEKKKFDSAQSSSNASWVDEDEVIQGEPEIIERSNRDGEEWSQVQKPTDINTKKQPEATTEGKMEEGKEIDFE